MQLKHDIGDIAGPALKAENPGSRWPKTTLAALRDRARLTPEQLQQLNGICRCALDCVDTLLALVWWSPYPSISMEFDVGKAGRRARHWLPMTRG